MIPYLIAKLGARKREAGVCPPVRVKKEVQSELLTLGIIVCCLTSLHPTKSQKEIAEKSRFKQFSLIPAMTDFLKIHFIHFVRSC
jgi:hypothetical protein